jgi:Icc-related predicted phosphoesterase
MRVLAAADVHGRRAVYDWLLAAARAHRVDALILAGDLLGCPEGFGTPEESQRHDACALAQLLDTAGVPVLYLMGNDDLVELEPVSPGVQSIHGRRLQRGRFAFVGYQYSLPFMGGVFERQEAGIAADLENLASLVDADTVFVSHSPALGILDPGFGETRIGSSSLADLLARRPFRAHIHGHSHAGFGRRGPHFNVASAGRARAMLLDLAAMEHQVLNAGPEDLVVHQGPAP